MKDAAGRTALRIHSQIPRARVSRARLLKCAQMALRHFRRPVSHVDFILVSARKMASLHRQFLGLPGPTDVMAFDLSENGEPLEGEVYICLEQAKRQAAFYGESLASEMARLAIHGVLHLAGEKDRTEAERKRMRALEEKILHEAGRDK
ncbi:MAG: rRNA maturation RNase YbeY [bacterium]